MDTTNIQEVIDSFLIKLPTVDFTGKEDMVFQLFKTAVAKCSRKPYDSLEYFYDTTIKEGYFLNKIHDDSIELVSMYMLKEYYIREFDLTTSRLKYLGTQAFNKIPSSKENFDAVSDKLKNLNDEIATFEMNLPDYSDER